MNAQRNGVGSGAGILRSNLANEEFIEWLPETMLAFAEQTGAGGFSFDLTYWEESLPVASEYAQWAGWRNILSQLTTGTGCAGARCVVDNRQANHAWGAWMWALGGTYAEPLMSDEQPGSWMFYEADLHTDRLAGNKQRQVAKSYRDEYCPNDALPGFAFHQTDRDPTKLQNTVCSAGRCSNFSRVRDFDLLGFRYSLLSSIGTGGLNNVINLLPARDTEEFDKFPKTDLAFVADWLEWADANVPLLKQTRPIPSLSTPGAGVVDGTLMLRKSVVDSDAGGGVANAGVMFLFNPTMREIDVSLPLSGDDSASLGFECAAAAAVGGKGLVLVRQLATSERSAPTAQKYNRDILDCTTGVLNLTLKATDSLVLEFDTAWQNEGSSSSIVVLGSPSTGATLNSNSGTLSVSGVQGESGTPVVLSVMLPASTTVKSVLVNGQAVHSFTAAVAAGGGGVKVTVERTVWAGQRFGRAHEVALLQEGESGSSSSWSGMFNVPQSAVDQLKERNTSYPIVYDTNPNSTDDANVPWLAPGRLLIFVKYASPLNNALNVTAAVDGSPLLIRKAYNTIVPSSSRFIGHWADVTPLLKPGKQQTLTLQLPETTTKLDGVFFENVETLFTSEFSPTIL